MAICPKCGGAMVYGEPHGCAERDPAKGRLLGVLAVGAVLGALAGYAYGKAVIARACSLPGAGNLCGLSDALAQPLYVIIGAVTGGCAAALVIFALGHSRR
jgi:hypothetical protein